MTKKIETNYRVGENKVSFSQTSKGFWYCNDITINCYSVIDGIALMDRAIVDAEKLLKKLNTKHDVEIGEGDASSSTFSKDEPRYDIDVLATTKKQKKKL